MSTVYEFITSFDNKCVQSVRDEIYFVIYVGDKDGVRLEYIFFKYFPSF